MSSCGISVMYDLNAVLRHTAPRTLLPHCSERPLRLFHSTCQTVIHLSGSPLPPSHLLYLFTHPYISPPYCIHHFSSSLRAFPQLCFPHKEQNNAHNLLWAAHASLHNIGAASKPSRAGCAAWITSRCEVSGGLMQFRDQSTKRCLSHLSTVECRSDSKWQLFPSAAQEGMTASQRKRRESASPKIHKVSAHLNNPTCQFSAATPQRTEAC